jgi:lactase-phlorizin hydrolase
MLLQYICRCLWHFSGEVGITLNTNWFEPLDAANSSHLDAANTLLRFQLGWYANPVLLDGDYPQVMKDKVHT